MELVDVALLQSVVFTGRSDFVHKQFSLQGDVVKVDRRPDELRGWLAGGKAIHRMAHSASTAHLAGDSARAVPIVAWAAK